MYAGAAWAPFVFKTQWQRLKSVQTIGITTILGLFAIHEEHNHPPLSRSQNRKGLNQNTLHSHVPQGFHLPIQPLSK